MSVRFFLFMILAFFVGSPLSAGEFSDVPDDYLEEVDHFHSQCLSDPHYSDYYDCTCLSLAYLDKRIERGARAGVDTIILDIGAQCLDGAGAARVRYEDCVSNAPLMVPAGQTTEEYCTCYGNNFARMFERLGARPNAKTFIRLQTQAMLSCQL